MARTRLFLTTDRHESHKKLEELIKLHPLAECREDPSTNEFSVWDGPRDAPPPAPSAPPPAPTTDLDILAAKVAEIVLARLALGKKE